MWTVLELLPQSLNQPWKQGENVLLLFHYQTENIKVTLGEGERQCHETVTHTNVIGNSAANVGKRKKCKHIFKEV
jgi:hypothetical protein